MDRLPRDIAQERMHQDIVKLLEEYRVNSPVAMNGFATSPPMSGTFTQHPMAKANKKKSRKSHPDHSQPNKVALPPMDKKKKKKGGHHHHHHHHHGHVHGMDHGSSPCAAASIDSGPCVMELPPSYETACSSGQSVVPLDISQNNIALDQATLHHSLNAEWMEHMQQLPHMMQAPHSGQYTSQSSPPSATESPLTAASSIGGSPNSQMATSPLTQSYSSPSNTTSSPGSITSPGSISTSPLNQQSPATSPPSVMSPPRKSLPTSPTHIQVQKPKTNF